MESNTQSEMPAMESVQESNVEMSAEHVTPAQAVTIDPSDPAHPDHPEHHKHMSALLAASHSHSAVNHSLPHHSGIDL